MLNDIGKTQRKENKMKQYALVKIGTSEPNTKMEACYSDYVEEVEGFYENPEQLKEAFDEAVESGPICGWEYDKDYKRT